MVLSKFIMLCNCPHHHQNSFNLVKRTLYPFNNNSHSTPPQTSAPDNHDSTFCLTILTTPNTSFKWEFIVFVLLVTGLFVPL